MGMLLVSKTYWLGMPFHFRKSVPEGTKIEPVYLKADDLRDCQGLYYAPPKVDKPKVAALAAHPRADFAKHYSFPRLLEAGVACFGLQTRCLNNDTHAIHEELILDVNAAVKFLKKQKGIEKVILFGNSGGGSLFAFFQAQALLPKEKRITHTPGGDLTRLPGAEMIPADALILVSCHKGEGKIMNECIDPSVVDEFDPSLTNPELDMYDERNGFKPPPEWSKYSKEFLEKFRKAQHERVKRLDDMARGYIEDARKAEKLFNKAKSEKWPFAEAQTAARRAAQERVMVIYRTMANPPYVDNTIDPSPRPYGSLLS
ncbi:MAG: hypothetical protein AB1405_06190, partial [Bdellovibrionota bacterium]